MLNQFSSNFRLLGHTVISSTNWRSILFGACLAASIAGPTFSQPDVTVNQTTARIALIKSLTDKAEQGDANAQFALAETLRKNAGTHLFVEAYANAWLLRAAKQGQRDAIKLARKRNLLHIPEARPAGPRQSDDANDFPPSITPPHNFVTPDRHTFMAHLRPASDAGRAALNADQQIGKYVQADTAPDGEPESAIKLGPFYDKAKAMAVIEHAATLGSFTSKLEQVRPR